MDAEKFRKLTGNEHSLEFNVIEAIEFLTKNDIGKGCLQIRYFDAPPDFPRARVKFRPLRLITDNGLWDSAKRGQPFDKFVLSHEIGHILKHDDQLNNAKAFSLDIDKRLRAFPEEETAEWQADRIADHLMLPWKLILPFRYKVLDLAAHCNVERVLVERQIEAYKRSMKFAGEACKECGNFTLARKKIGLRCETCGATTDV